MIPGPGCGLIIIRCDPVSLLFQLHACWCLGQSTFTPTTVPLFTWRYLFSFLSCAVQFLSMISMGSRQILCATTETNSLCLGLPQANSSLFEPAALVYLSRQHQKSDSYHRCAWLEWKNEALVMHGEVKNNYEHNAVVMNLLLSPKTADDVILIV